MLNRERTVEVFGYDLDPTVRRRKKTDFIATGAKYKRSLLVIDNCPSCGKERQITLHASRKNKSCPACISKMEHVIEARRNQSKAVSEETRQKMKDSHWSKRGFLPANKGVTQTDEFKATVSAATKKWNDARPVQDKQKAARKAACTKRQISIDQWTPSTEEAQLVRGSADYKVFEKAVRDRDMVCQYPGCASISTSSNMTVHHKDGFHWCIDRRFDVDNGVLLCKEHHAAFHNTYRRANNTEAQFLQWIAPKPAVLPKLFIVFGCSGSGKTWVSNQLTDKYHVVHYDTTPKATLLDVLRSQPTDKPILLDLPIKISTFIRRHSDEFDIRCVAVMGDFIKVKQQILNRGGKITPTLYKRWKIIKQRAVKYAEFTGDSDEVLSYLKTL